MTAKQSNKTLVWPVLKHERVLLVIGRAEYAGIVKEVSLGSKEQLISFTAQLIGSGRSPIRCLGKDEGTTWKRIARGAE